MSYTIRRGDTLSALAARFHTTVGALARANGIKNVNLIITGHSLNIPGRGDSFESSSVGGRFYGAGAGGLAAAARRVAQSMGGTHSQGLCATGVSRALMAMYGIRVWGNGNQIDDNLPRSRFKQVNLSLEEALKIPGLILTWEKTGSRLGSIYGHTAITAGDGHTSYSDYIEANTLGSSGARQGLKIFMPI